MPVKAAAPDSPSVCSKGTHRDTSRCRKAAPRTLGLHNQAIELPRCERIAVWTRVALDVCWRTENTFDVDGIVKDVDVGVVVRDARHNEVGWLKVTRLG